MTLFYTHLIEIESVIEELDKMDLSKEEKMHLAQLLDSSLHHTILDAIFSQLTEEDKKTFVAYLQENEHKKIWKFLQEKIDDVEDKIKKVAKDLKDNLHKDLKEAKKLHG